MTRKWSEMEPGELYTERLERLEAVIKGKEPDRVPVHAETSLFHAHYAGYTAKDITLDYLKNKDAALKTARDFNFDTLACITGVAGFYSFLALMKDAPQIAPSAALMQAPFHKILNDVYTRWPGIEIEDDAAPQFIGREVMSSDEYAKLAEDPYDFINRVLLPRICRSLNDPGSSEYNAALTSFGAEINKFNMVMGEMSAELSGKYEVPLIPTGWSSAPLDFLSDFLRDMKNLSLDLYRCPEKVKVAVDALTPVMVESAKVTGTFPEEVRKQAGTDIVQCMFPLHLNEYLNPKLYDEYFWPSLLEVLEEVIKMGQTPFVVFEGRQDAHLESLLDLPKGKVIGLFDKTDPRKVRDVLGDHLVLVSGPPNSLLIAGTPQKVETYVKSLLDDCKEGGMIVTPGVDGGISGSAKPENVKALVDAVIKYGGY
ncbi:uroporphyrinogen-III decarboxylase [Methanomicrobium sp. W14]|uniref:uroporphyrinogen decarboxylase family protein n=1 Tax=Methanomicrobium sp. W14 TaxID=2817839 RepID=UPI00247A5035|nr:uroporphyrinogen decarboxylase family protein [Methanomicrobium sp. W14]MBP2134222.1 uroporphyrinogen-III decarboxylase [Methanomicrobium sp. W14]